MHTSFMRNRAMSFRWFVLASQAANIITELFRADQHCSDPKFKEEFRASKEDQREDKAESNYLQCLLPPFQKKVCNL